MNRIIDILEQNKLDQLPIDILCNIFKEITYYKNIGLLVSRFPNYAHIIYKCVRTIDFVGHNLVFNDKVNVTKEDNLPTSFDLEKFLMKFPGLQTYRVSINNTHKDYELVLNDVRAKHIHVSFLNYENIEEISKQLYLVLGKRYSKYGTSFTCVFTRNTIYMYYKDGVIDLEYFFWKSLEYGDIIDVILNTVKIHTIINLLPSYWYLVEKHSSIDTIITKSFDYHILEVIPSNIKNILFRPDFIRSSRVGGFPTLYIDERYTYPNLEVLEYPIHVEENVPELFPNVLVFHCEYEYKVKDIIYRINNNYINARLTFEQALKLLKTNQRFLKEVIDEGRDYNINVAGSELLDITP